MNAVIFNPQYVDSVARDPGKLNPTTELVSTCRSRRPLVCRWQRTAEGRLACTWRQISPDEAVDPVWGGSRGIATPDMKSMNETLKPDMISEMSPRRSRALEIEAYAVATVVGATEAQLPVISSGQLAAPPQTPNRDQAVTQWITIALLLAGAWLELVLCLTVESSGML